MLTPVRANKSTKSALGLTGDQVRITLSRALDFTQKLLPKKWDAGLRYMARKWSSAAHPGLEWEVQFRSEAVARPWIPQRDHIECANHPPGTEAS